MKTMISVKLDRDLKMKAVKLADHLGLNLSSVISSTLRNFVENEELHVTLKPKMTPYLERIIAKVRKEKPGDGSPVFDNAKDAIDWLNKRKFIKN